LRRWGGLPVVIVVAVAVAVAVAACGGGTAAQRTKPAGPSRLAAATVGSAQPYQLYTHCGIDEARIGNRYFEALHPLSDGSGNPPTGWGNPYQKGTVTLLSPAKAVFRDDAGHQVLFRLRRGATSFKHLCS
jgi:hypothetical protein